MQGLYSEHFGILTHFTVARYYSLPSHNFFVGFKGPLFTPSFVLSVTQEIWTFKSSSVWSIPASSDVNSRREGGGEEVEQRIGSSGPRQRRPTGSVLCCTVRHEKIAPSAACFSNRVDLQMANNGSNSDMGQTFFVAKLYLKSARPDGS